MIVQKPDAVLTAPNAEAMRQIGQRLATLLRAGDVIIANGDLGAGKTTFTQGLGAGLQVRGPIISPTFVISRIHKSLVSGPDLVHVDAYRLGDAAELEDLDLEESLAHCVTLVEWGQDKAEGLSQNRLEIYIRRSSDPEDDTRQVEITGVGARWQQAGLEEL